MRDPRESSASAIRTAGTMVPAPAAAQSLAAGMPIDGARVRHIRAAIAAGTYALSPARMANALRDSGLLR